MKLDTNLGKLKAALAVLVFAAALRLPSPAAPGPAAGTETISISGAWALYPLAVKWRDEFVRSHPGIQIDVQAGGAGKGVTDCLAGVVDIGMVSRDIKPTETEKGIKALAVARDAVVAVINRSNPLVGEIMKKGLAGPVFSGIWIKGAVKNWEEALGAKASGKAPIHVFTRSDACGAAETWAAYLGGHQEDLQGIGVYGDPGLAEAVRRDALGIGYNNVNYAYDPKTGRPVDGLVVCPIDINGNGHIDPEENFYATRDVLVSAIARRVYPSPPARDLYFVVKGHPQSAAVAVFLRWVLTDGQKFNLEMGYISPSPEVLTAGRKFIGGAFKEAK